MVLRRRLTDKAPARKLPQTVRDAVRSPAGHNRKRKRIDDPKDFDKFLLKVCAKLAPLLKRTRPLHADIEAAYRTERFRSLPRPTIEVLAVGLWSIDYVERWRKGRSLPENKGSKSADQSRNSKPWKKYRNSRRRLNYLVADSKKIIPLEVGQELRDDLERRPEALIDDRLDRFRTHLLIGFMHKVGDDKVLLDTWRPLSKMLQLFFVVVLNRKKLQDDLHGEDLEEALAVALKNNIRGRVNYLAENFHNGNIPGLGPNRIFGQVYKTVRRALDS